MIANNKPSSYFEHLFRYNQSAGLDFASIDKNRKEMGQPSLYFSYVENNIPVPDYYKDNPVGPCY